jgi:hypothetical protein
MPKVVIAVACLGVVVGCAHRTQIVSQPAGASVYVNGTFACTTPCMYETPATQLQPHTPIRLEREGYQPVESELKTGILASRIVGGIFTLGIVPLFKWPRTYYAKHEFTLRPMTKKQRLEQVEQMWRDGTITEDEYRRLRLSVLGAGK